MKENKYYLFAGETFYPEGGFYDFRNSFDTLEEAKKAGEEFISFEEISFGWCHIVFRNQIILTLTIDVMNLEKTPLEWER